MTSRWRDVWMRSVAGAILKTTVVYPSLYHISVYRAFGAGPTLSDCNSSIGIRSTLASGEHERKSNLI